MHRFHSPRPAEFNSTILGSKMKVEWIMNYHHKTWFIKREYNSRNILYQYLKSTVVSHTHTHTHLCKLMLSKI